MSRDEETFQPEAVRQQAAGDARRAAGDRARPDAGHRRLAGPHLRAARRARRRRADHRRLRARRAGGHRSCWTRPASTCRSFTAAIDEHLNEHGVHRPRSRRRRRPPVRSASRAWRTRRWRPGTAGPDRRPGRAPAWFELARAAVVRFARRERRRAADPPTGSPSDRDLGRGAPALHGALADPTPFATIAYNAGLDVPSPRRCSPSPSPATPTAACAGSIAQAHRASASRR